MTDAVIADLSPDELAAVVSHELAHLSRQHHRTLVTLAEVDAALGWVPGIRATTRHARLAVERSADDAAASAVDGELVSAALVRFAAEGAAPGSVDARGHALAACPVRASWRVMLVCRTVPAAVAMGAIAVVVGASVLARHGVRGIVGICSI